MHQPVQLGFPHRSEEGAHLRTGVQPEAPEVTALEQRWEGPVGDTERGPMIKMRADDARLRLVSENELVRIVTDRRQELAELQIDDSLARGSVVLRDVVGASISEVIRVIKLDTDAGTRA